MQLPSPSLGRRQSALKLKKSGRKEGPDFWVLGYWGLLAKERLEPDAANARLKEILEAHEEWVKLHAAHLRSARVFEAATALAAADLSKPEELTVGPSTVELAASMAEALVDEIWDEHGLPRVREAAGE